MRFIATIIVGLLLPLSFAAPSEATRPIVGFDYPDLCSNVKGKQTILSVTAGIWELTGEPNKRGKYVCVPGWRSQTTKSAFNRWRYWRR